MTQKQPYETTTMDPKTYMTTSEGGAIAIERAKEKKLVRKLDLHIIPVVMLLYLLSFLDR